MKLVCGRIDWLNLRGQLIAYWLLMSFSAVNEFGLKFSRLYLNMCNWVLVKMSMNCKVHGMKGGFSSKFRLKKARESQHGPSRWRRQLLFLWLFFVAIGFIWLLISSSYGRLGRKVEAPPHLDGDTTNFLLQHFNVSMEEIHSLASNFLDTDQVSCSLFQISRLNCHISRCFSV